MVLASDGLWDVMTNEDVVEMVQQILAEMAEEDDEREEDGAGAGTGWDVAGAGGPDYHVIARLLTLEVSRGLVGSGEGSLINECWQESTGSRGSKRVRT